MYNFLRGLFYGRNKGIEMVEVAILIAIAITIGLVFKTQIGNFIDKIFGDLMNADF